MNFLRPALSLSSGTGCNACRAVLTQHPGLGVPSLCFGALGSRAEGGAVFQRLPWHHQQVRTVKRGTEYQPKNIKRIRTHGWLKRISTRGGIEVILRRMLKGRKSLTH